ncbi:MAG: AMP-binding protein [Betaproteobacteria bacterium]|nr:AMP-binding protein [Betaproteobacteria bacterium]
MSQLLTIGEILTANAALYPDRPGARDSRRALSFRQWNDRACRLANGLIGLGLEKGDRVAILAYNCVEWMEIYGAISKSGLIAVPVNFRLMPQEIRYIVEDCDARAIVVQHDLVDRIEAIRGDLAITADRLLHFGGTATPAGYRSYEDTIGRASASEPGVPQRPDEPWALMYTSGTTGKPKGAIRSHEGSAALALVTELDMGLSRSDTGLFVMPMCHANSLYFAFSFTYCGAGCFVYDRASFDPEHLLRTFSEQAVTFTSLVPTHYIMMLGLPGDVKSRYEAGSLRKLVISSAPARRETKLAILEHFRNSELFEMYGSTEAGWATVLRPDEQLTKLGSIGREWTGSGRIRLLDDEGVDVPDGEAGELFSRTPYTFQGYWNLPEKTAQAFRGPYCSVGDMARRDEDGFYYLVDRKSNMIISGGENVYPSEVEAMLGSHPKIKDVGVIGLPHEKWGEAVHAVVILREGASATEAEILDWCRDKIAGYKRPRTIAFMVEADMPRTATGKIVHRLLKEKFTR